MAKKTSYQDILKQEMTDMFNQLDLPHLYKQAIKARWLDQVLWMEKKADQCRIWHYRLRLTTIIGGVILPALVGINFQMEDNKTFKVWFPWLTFGLSQVIAVSAAVEEFCRYGDRWRQYRQSVESLKTEGWQYLQSSGPYHKYKTHVDGYSMFASRVESIIKEDVQTYITELMKQKAEEEEEIKKIVAAAKDVPPPQFPASEPVLEPLVTTTVASGGNGNGAATAIATVAPVSAATLPVMASATALSAAASAIGQEPKPGTAGLLKVLQDTVFKLQPKPSESLNDNEKVLVKGGSTYSLHSYTVAENNHIRVALSDITLGADHRNTWYVYAGHVELPGSSTTGNGSGLQKLIALTNQRSNSNSEIRLKVPYFSQRDNQIKPYSTCNTSSCAMVAKYLGAKISSDDEYYTYVEKYGESEDHSAQNQALTAINIKSTWNTNLDFDDLDKSLEAGFPIVIGILHHGPLEAPSGGHMLVVIGRNANRDYICNDPYGDLMTDYQSTNGNGVIYSRKVLSHRWLVEGPKSGWGRLFYGNSLPA